jgi:hypothetical protein
MILAQLVDQLVASGPAGAMWLGLNGAHLLPGDFLVTEHTKVVQSLGR